MQWVPRMYGQSCNAARIFESVNHSVTWMLMLDRLTFDLGCIESLICGVLPSTRVLQTIRSAEQLRVQPGYKILVGSCQSAALIGIDLLYSSHFGNGLVLGSFMAGVYSKALGMTKEVSATAAC